MVTHCNDVNNTRARSIIKWNYIDYRQAKIASNSSHRAHKKVKRITDDNRLYK